MHILRVAYTGLNESPFADGFPLVAPAGSKSINKVSWFSWKIGLGLVILVTGGFGKLVSTLPGLSVREALAYSYRQAAKYIMENAIAALLTVESGLLDGFCESVWPEYPRRFNILIRTVTYAYLSFYYGLAGRAWSWIKSIIPGRILRIPFCYPTYSDPPGGGIKPNSPSHGKSPPPSRTPSSAPESPCDYEEDLRMGSFVLMNVHGKTMPLSHRECEDPIAEAFHLISEDMQLPHLPQGGNSDGVGLCQAHLEVYRSLRGSYRCVQPKCNVVGSVAPDGHYYCPAHIINAVAPAQPKAKVKFSGSSKAKEDPVGLSSLPEWAILSLYKRLSHEGLSEAEIVSKLTQEHGGDLLENARVAHQAEESESDRAFKDMQRRLDQHDKVDYVGRPRAPPSPHPDPMPDIPIANHSAPVIQGRVLPAPAVQIFPPSHASLVLQEGREPVSEPPVILPSISVPSLTIPYGAAPVLSPAFTPRMNQTTEPLFGASPTGNIPPPATGIPLGLNQYSHRPAAIKPIGLSPGHATMGGVTRTRS